MGRILCWLGLHYWTIPLRGGPIACLRCGRERLARY